MRENNITGKQKLVNLAKSILQVADQTKEKQIGTSKETYEPMYGKSIQLFLPSETIEELKQTLNELSEVEDEN